MDATETGFQTARAMMVDSQVRPNKVTDRRIVDAMRWLPREKFVPANCRALAYSDEDVPLGNGRYLTEPMVVARLVQLAEISPGERVLVVAAGTGYSAALLAACGAQVTAVEDAADLLSIARPALAANAPGVTLVTTAPSEGHPAGGPYDVVFVDTAAELVPEALGRQVKRQGGRFVGILSTGARVGHAVIGVPAGEGLSLRPVFECATPALPAFRRVAGFIF